MSGAGEERWRTRGHQSGFENQNLNQHRRSSQQGQTPAREAEIGGQHQRTHKSGTQGLTAMPGNAWANSSERSNRDALGQGPAREQHVPVNGFNAQEARDILRLGMFVYRHSSTMANGKDFFLELRKQLSSIQQPGPERAGG
ncbi:MAG: hypothetical protein Q9169_004038 [Polycauliona sp. 2 TL-2023]